MYIEGNMILEKYWIMSIRINLNCKNVFDNKEKANSSSLFLPRMLDLTPKKLYNIFYLEIYFLLI